MDSFQSQPNIDGFAVPPITNPPQHHYFGGNDQDTSPMMENFSMSQFFGDEIDNGNADDSTEAKRRRIARVRRLLDTNEQGPNVLRAGLRHVPEKEDQM